ncbi:MAG TPA: hypothetical protein VHN80_05255 [Kineosporiaceae bacterium]|nr:hypothetical protein [Kineosporiaceae bacterium]
MPIERGRAAGVLIGLIAFTAGFAAAGLLVLAGWGGTPPYLVSITVGLVGVGVVGFYLHRGTVELPQARIWQPVMLRAFISALRLPESPILVAIYGLGLVGVIGNIVVPMTRR